MTVSIAGGSYLTQDLSDYADLVINFSPVLNPDLTPDVKSIDFT